MAPCPDLNNKRKLQQITVDACKSPVARNEILRSELRWYNKYTTWTGLACTRPTFIFTCLHYCENWSELVARRKAVYYGLKTRPRLSTDDYLSNRIGCMWNSYAAVDCTPNPPCAITGKLRPPLKSESCTATMCRRLVILLNSAFS